MHLTPLENVLWAVGTALNLLLCVLAFYRQLYRRLPFFTVYVVLLVAEEVVVRSANHYWGYTSLPVLYAYWVSLGVVVLARGCTIVELCHTSLRKYPGIWSFIWKLLSLTALILVAFGAVAAARNRSWMPAFVVTADRGLELAAAIILVALLSITVRYRVWLEPVERNIVLGLAMYCIFRVLHSGFLNTWINPYLHWWSAADIAVFDLAMVIWLIPLLKPLPVPIPAPVLISEQASLYLLRRILDRMRELANELKRLGRAIRK